MEISPKQLQLFTEAMHHMTLLNLSGVLRTCSYDAVIRAISVSMPNLKALDISRSFVQPSAIENLVPTKRSRLRGCPELAYLNLAENSFVTVELLKKILLRLPKLQYLKHALLLKTLTELTESEMDEDTGRCLKYLYSGWSFDCYSNETYYDALLKAPMLHRLGNITQVDIEVIDESEHFLKAILMQLKKIKVLTLHSFSKSREFLLPVLEANGGCLEHLHLHDLSGGLNLSDVMRTCPGLVELTMYCSTNNGSQIPKVETSTLDPVLTCLRKCDLHFTDKHICSKATLASLLMSPYLEEILLSNVESMSNNVMFYFLLCLRDGYVQSSKVKKITLDCCPNITEEPFVRWLSMEDCILQFLCIQLCSNVNCKDLIAAAEMYPKALSLVVN